ncbi:TonB-dependent receptor plug domain-containing protein [Undibacterium sp. TJN19]|uniref:TonB-dependent receptor plug domain-containing protein n=1 Tax=Undibacterium sp. TJN19 TaxID=3413055 RepID=UPI003BF431B9
MTRTLWLAFGSMMLPLAVQAQDARPDAKPDNVKEADKGSQRVEITGSSIKRIDQEQSSPIQIVRREQIEQMGANTLQQVLANISANVPDLKDSQSLFTGMDGASSANLRGLGTQATLVLLNGRRLSSYGATYGFQYQFVNIDSIPVDAIERVEILADGASAIYGSDAIAGVINVITKTNYRGLDVRMNGQKSMKTHSNGEYGAAVTYGFGDLATDKFNVFGSLSYYQRDAVYLPDILSSIPDSYYQYHPSFLTNMRIAEGSGPGVLNPGTLFAFSNVGTNRAPAQGCPTPLSLKADGSNTTCALNTLNLGKFWVPSSKRTNGFLSAHYDVNENVQAFAELALTHIDLSTSVGPPNFSSGDYPSWYARNTGVNLNTLTFPYLSANNPYNTLPARLQGNMGGVAGLSYRFLDAAGLAKQSTVDDEFRLVTGLKGTTGRWDWETALTLAGTHSVMNQRGSNPSVSGLLAAFGPYTKDPKTGYTLMSDNPAYKFGVDNASNRALLEKMYPNVQYPSWDKVANLDGKVSGKIATLPAGDVMMAAGFNLNYENYSSPGDTAAANGDIWWQGGSWFKGQRTSEALFAEFLVPVTKSIEADFAIRDDKYPGFDNNIVPKVGLKIQALNSLLLRGTYSEGFRAPSLAESGTGGIYAVSSVQDPVRCTQTNAIAAVLMKSANPNDVTTGRNLLNSECSAYNIGGVTSPNANLMPEKAKISTIGFVFQPTKDFDISADYYFINRKNEINAENYNQLLERAITKYGPDVGDVPGVLLRTPISPQDKANQGQAATVCAANPGLCSKLPVYTVGLMGGMIGSYINQSQTLVDGFDVNANARFALADYGRLTLGLQTTIARRFIVKGADGEWQENSIGSYNTPRITGRFSSSWNYGNWDVSLAANYTGPQRLQGVGGWYDPSFDPDSCETRLDTPKSLCSKGIASITTWTSNVSWKPRKDIKIDLNIQNLFNKQPEYDPRGTYGVNNYDNFLGRLVKLSFNYQFK